MHLLDHPRVVCDERLHRGRRMALSRCHARHERRRGRPGRRDVPSVALGTPSRIVSRSSSRPGRRAPFPASARLVLVLGVLALVSSLLLLREALPVVLDLLWLLAPQLADDLGDVRVR